MSGAARLNKEERLRRLPPVRLKELAAQIGAVLHGGDPQTLVNRMAPLHSAAAGSIAFYDNARYRSVLRQTAATAVIMQEGDLPLCPVAALVAAAPREAYAKAMQYLYPGHTDLAKAGVSAAAVVDEGAIVHADATVWHGAVVEAGARIAANVYVGPFCHVAAGVGIASGSRLAGSVTLLPGTTIGERVLIHPGTVIGSDGFGFVMDALGLLKVPQTGGVRIGNNVEIGANCTIDCGTMEDTVVGDGVKIDDQVHIGHNVRIGKATIISGGTLVGGSTVIGATCLIGGGAMLADNIEIADGVSIVGGSRIARSVTTAGGTVADFSVPVQQWRREVTISTRDLLRRVRVLEERVL